METILPYQPLFVRTGMFFFSFQFRFVESFYGARLFSLLFFE